MTKPIRIQRKRIQGFKTPDNTVYVGRGSRWGNPFVVGKDGTREDCIKKYAAQLLPYTHQPPNNTLDIFYQSQAMLDEIQHYLKGKNLSCWCKLSDACHADWLLNVANNT